jgi:hypothetical protein
VAELDDVYSKHFEHFGVSRTFEQLVSCFGRLWQVWERALSWGAREAGLTRLGRWHEERRPVNTWPAHNGTAAFASPPVTREIPGRKCPPPIHPHSHARCRRTSFEATALRIRTKPSPLLPRPLKLASARSTTSPSQACAHPKQLPGIPSSFRPLKPAVHEAVAEWARMPRPGQLPTIAHLKTHATLNSCVLPDRGPPCFPLPLIPGPSPRHPDPFSEPSNPSEPTSIPACTPPQGPAERAGHGRHQGRLACAGPRPLVHAWTGERRQAPCWAPVPPRHQRGRRLHAGAPTAVPAVGLAGALSLPGQPAQSLAALCTRASHPHRPRHLVAG